MRIVARITAIALVAGAAGALACASGGGEETAGRVEASAEAPRFDNWRALFRHHIPRARLRGECIQNIGRGADSPPVIEVEGQRSYDGCPPPSYQPEEIVRVELLDASEAGMLLGSRGEGGLVRMYTE